MNPGLPASRATDRALRGHADRTAVTGLLVQLHYAIWEIRTGEISCNDTNDMIKNVTKFTRRINLAGNVTLRGRLDGTDITHIQEYSGFLERYYVFMYSQDLRDEFFETVQGTATFYDRLAYPLTLPAEYQYQKIGGLMPLEPPARPVLRDSSVGRARSRSR